MENSETTYIKGFNSGYLLAKHEPSLLSQVVKQLTPSTDYLEGLFSGKEEYKMEQQRDQLSELSRLRDGSKDKDQHLELE